MNLPPCRNMKRLKGSDGGLACPACRAQTAVLNTRHTDTGTVRNRGCPSCHYRFATLETYRPDKNPTILVDINLTG